MKLNTSITLKAKMFLYILIGMVWCQTILMQYVRAVVARLPIIGAMPDEIMTFLYIIVALIAVREIKIHTGDFIVFLSIIFVYLISPVIFPNTYTMWEENVSIFLLQVLPLYFVGVAIGNQQKEDWGKICNLLYILSLITVVVRIVYFFTSGDDMTEAESRFVGDMDGAYHLLPHLCMIIYHVIKKTNLINISVLVIGSFFLLFLGNRGSVLIEVICFALMVMFFAKWKYKVLKVALIVSALIAFLYSPLLENVIMQLYDISKNMGLSVRIFDSFLSGNITESAGRDAISDTLYAALSENNFGYGLYADRLLAGDSYAHKIYLELWIQFGIIFGTIICGIILLLPVRVFFWKKNEGIRGLLLVLYCSSILKLFMSSSYLNEPLLFLTFGISVALLKKREV